jgi:hypothetical protein
MIKSLIVLSTIITLRALTATAQQLEPITAVGLPQTEFSGSDIEHVDLMSGALQVKLPLIKLPGRGIDTDIELSYSSKSLWSTSPNTFTYDDDISVTTYLVEPSTIYPPTPSYNPKPEAWGPIGMGWFLGFPEMGTVSDESVQQISGDFILYTETWSNNDGSNIGFTQSNGVFDGGIQEGCDPTEDCAPDPNRSELRYV